MNLWIVNSPGFTNTYSLENSGTSISEEDLKLFEKVFKSIPLGRFGEPLDIAKGIVFLSSIDAQFITGANLLIDGGILYNLPPSSLWTEKFE